MNRNYISRGHERDVFEGLEIEGDERLQLRCVLGGKIAGRFFEGISKLGERGMIAAVQRTALDELPDSIASIPAK